MKIIFDKDDQTFIKSLKNAKKDGKNHPLLVVDDEEECSLIFKVIDSAKASAFLFEITRCDDFGKKALEDAIGIHIKTFTHRSNEIKLNQMKELMKEFEYKAKEILK